MPAALLAGLLSLGAPEAGVPPTTVELRWAAPAECPSKADVEAELRTVTDGAVVVVDADAPTVIDATVAETADGFRMELRIERRGVGETQSMDSKTCDTLARAVVLVAGVDLTRPLDPPEPAATVEPPPEPPVSPPPETNDEPEPAPADAAPRDVTDRPSAEDDVPAKDIRAVLGIEAGPSLGVVPSITAALTGFVGVRLNSVQVDVSGFHHFEASEAVVQSARIAGSLSGGSVRGCWVPNVERFEFPLCAGVALAALRTSPSAGVQSPRTLTDLWVGATLSAAVAWRIRQRFAVTLRLQGAASVRRPGVHWTVGGERLLAFRTEPVAGALLLGPQIRLP